MITGLIYNKPDDPISFLENAIAKIRQNPDLEYTWNLFVDDETFQKYEENQPGKHLVYSICQHFQYFYCDVKAPFGYGAELTVLNSTCTKWERYVTFYLRKGACTGR